MLIKGTVVEIKTYETAKGKVANLCVREEPYTSLVFHAALWKDMAEMIEGKLQEDDVITMSGYASRIEKLTGQICVENFNLIEVKRPVVVSEQLITIEQLQNDSETEGVSYE